MIWSIYKSVLPILPKNKEKITRKKNKKITRFSNICVISGTFFKHPLMHNCIRLALALDSVSAVYMYFKLQKHLTGVSMCKKTSQKPSSYPNRESCYCTLSFCHQTNQIFKEVSPETQYFGGDLINDILQNQEHTRNDW